jgi:molybdate transport system substrate-binding protein
MLRKIPEVRMSTASRSRSALVAVLFVLSATACGSSSKPSTSSTTSTVPGSARPALSGPLNVFAASSLTEAFKTEQTNLDTSNSGLSLTFNFAGSQALVTQIQQGADVDVFASADTKNMKKLEDAGLVDPPRTFARNRLEIAVAPGNPKHITSLADLERSGVTLVLADVSVPAGKYARQAFTNAGLPAPEPVSNELDVKSALSKLTLGEADAVVVYVTDVKAAGNKVEGVTIPDAQNVVAVYPIAVLKAAKHAAAAAAFVDEIATGGGQQVLKDKGFLPPS